MRKRLGEVTNEPLALGHVLFGEQAQIIPDLQEPLEEFPSLVLSTQEDVIISQPEAARQESALSTGKPVPAFRCVVPTDKPIGYQMLLDSGDRSADSWIGRRQKSH